MSFTELAARRLLTTAEPLLAELTWEVAPDSYQELRGPFPIQDDLDAILTLLARRGLEPWLVDVVLDSYPDRPMERALIAWDVLRNTLLGPDDAALVERLHRELAPVRDLAPIGPVPVQRDRILDLIAVVTSEPPDEVRMVAMPSLAQWATLPALTDELVARTIAHAKALARAHLPSLALAFLHLAWVRFPNQELLDLMVEIGLDHARAEALPLLEDTDPRSLQRGVYASIRLQLTLSNNDQAQLIYDSVGPLAELTGAKPATLLVAGAELALLKDAQLDEAMNTILDAHSAPSAGWPYAQRVHHLRQMCTAEATQEIESWIADHGNHGHLWEQAVRRTRSKPALLQLLSREVRYLSHDPVVWRALAIASGAPAAECRAIAAEIRQRLGAQLRAAMAPAARSTAVHPSFLALVEQRGLQALLPAITPTLAELTWDVAPDDARDLSDDTSILRSMRRRGLEAQLVSALLDQWAARPAERAMVACDVARTSLLAVDDGAFTARIGRELHELGPAEPDEDLAATAKRLSGHVAKLLAAQPAGDDAARSPTLAGLLGTGPFDAAAILAHARTLSAARLPMLAQTFLWLLQTRVTGELLDTVLDTLLEIRAEHRMLAERPLEPQFEDILIRRSTYEATREKLENNQLAAALMVHGILEENEPTVKQATDPRLRLIKADLLMLKGQPFDATAVDRIASEHPDWHYAARVRDSIAFRSDPARSPQRMAAFIARFGNDDKLWFRAARHPKVRGKMLAVLSRELRYGSHDPDVWLALACFADEAFAMQADAHVRQQLAAQMASVARS